MVQQLGNRVVIGPEAAIDACLPILWRQLEVARDQVEGGAQILDVNMDDGLIEGALIEVELIATALVLFYFATAIFTYFVHGLLRDTDNQLQPPFRIGRRNLPGAAIGLLMWTLIIAETGGFLVLFYGVLIAIF